MRQFYVAAALAAICLAPIIWTYVFIIGACIVAARADAIHDEIFKVYLLDKQNDL